MDDGVQAEGRLGRHPCRENGTAHALLPAESNPNGEPKQCQENDACTPPAGPAVHRPGPFVTLMADDRPTGWSLASHLLK